ncbi:MAG: DNA-protecting protein DprA [Clostridia bacterium]|nr:DNA-protecting protein DprA [Clostridia bacterium]
MERQVNYYLAFNCIFKLRSGIIASILDFFAGDAEAAWHHPERWADIAILSSRVMSDVLAQRNSIAPDKLYAAWRAYGCHLTCLGDADYPQALTSIYDPPLLLFYWGELPGEHELCLALIGSRRVTPYGCQVAEILSRDLAYQGACIVSGMARGIDTICHKAALAASGRTVAVLGSGLDVIYPRENSELYRKICESGAVISEFPLGTLAFASNFPRRNRIISGLAAGVVVIEADVHSGTMHTVNHALEQGKDVFAIPGPITSPCSRGTNKLIQECPKLVMATSAADIWGKYTDRPLRQVPQRDQVSLQAGTISAEERKILQLTLTPLQFDELAAQEQLGLSAATLAATLTMLEIRGLIKQLPGKYYQAVVKNIG